MSDEEFIAYCEAHSRTERKGFVPAHIARLLRLAGDEKQAADFEALSVQIISVDLSDLCVAARARLSAQPQSGHPQ